MQQTKPIKQKQLVAALVVVIIAGVAAIVETEKLSVIVVVLVADFIYLADHLKFDDYQMIYELLVTE